MSISQRDELLMKLMLVLARDRRAMQGSVRSVGFIREYKELPEDLGVYTLSECNEDEIFELASQMQIKMKPQTAKFHVTLNDVRYVFTSLYAKPLVLLDVITRDELYQIGSHASIAIDKLEQDIHSCLERRSGVEGTDETNGLDGRNGVNGDITVKLNDPAESFVAHQREWQKLMSYLLFVGDKQGNALHAADQLFDFIDPLKMNSWSIYTKEQALAWIWEGATLRFEVRTKEESEQLAGSKSWTGHLPAGQYYEMSLSVGMRL